MKIKVTPEDIAQGKRGDATCCAVALAARRAGLQGVRVDGDGMTWGTDSSNEGFSSISDAVHYFIEKFDAGQLVDPFEFEINTDGSEF